MVRFDNRLTCFFVAVIIGSHMVSSNSGLLNFGITSGNFSLFGFISLPGVSTENGKNRAVRNFVEF